MTTTTTPTVLTDGFERAYDGAWYTILGAGGDLSEWVTGITDLWEKEGIGTPTEFFSTKGADVNSYIARKAGDGPVPDDERLPDDLTVLLIPLDGLNLGRLAITKLLMEDRWFNDLVDNTVWRIQEAREA